MGLDLLVLKDKRVREEPYDKEIEAQAQIITATEKSELKTLDTEDFFKITLDRNEETIVALHFATLRMEKPLNIIKGKTAESVYSKIVELGLVKRLDHASYLGSELAKAEVALKTGKAYIQDAILFER